MHSRSSSSSSSGAICRLPRQHCLATRYRSVRLKLVYCTLKSNTALQLRNQKKRTIRISRNDERPQCQVGCLSEIAFLVWMGANEKILYKLALRMLRLVLQAGAGKQSVSVRGRPRHGRAVTTSTNRWAAGRDYNHGNTNQLSSTSWHILSVKPYILLEITGVDKIFKYYRRVMSRVVVVKNVWLEEEQGNSLRQY